MFCSAVLWILVGVLAVGVARVREARRPIERVRGRRSAARRPIERFESGVSPGVAFAHGGRD
jgi:hypothetical protein